MKEQEVIGLIPAAGKATRIAPLPLSKELYPIGFRSVDRDNNLRPKVACHYLLENMRLAGINKAYIILRSGKWDIPTYLGGGDMLNMHLGYLMMGLPYGVPYTLDRAYPFVKNTLVALGFPDILFQPDDVFVRLLARQKESKADIVLGLFPNDRPQKAGMVDFDTKGQVRSVVEKPSQSDLRYMWGVALWTPRFTQFIHDYLADAEANRIGSDDDKNTDNPRELPISNVIQAGIESGLRVEAEVFAEGEYLDIGTPDDLVQAVRHFSN